MAEAQYIARVTCRQLVLIEVETLDRAGRRVKLIPKLHTRVRFPSPAPSLICAICSMSP